MNYSLKNINQLESIVNAVEQYGVVNLYKVVVGNNGKAYMTRLGEYEMFGGYETCNLYCDKSLVSAFKTKMNEKGYAFSKEKRGKVR